MKLVELTDNNIEATATYRVQRVIEERFAYRKYFTFVLEDGSLSREYSMPRYTYRTLEE